MAKVEFRGLQTARSAAVLSLALLSGCTLVLPVGSYLFDRAHDLTEVARLGVEARSYGARVNLGPAVAGYQRFDGAGSRQ